MKSPWASNPAGAERQVYRWSNSAARLVTVVDAPSPKGRRLEDELSARLRSVLVAAAKGGCADAGHPTPRHAKEAAAALRSVQVRVGTAPIRDAAAVPRRGKVDRGLATVDLQVLATLLDAAEELLAGPRGFREQPIGLSPRDRRALEAMADFNRPLPSRQPPAERLALLSALPTRHAS